ncbi:MAG TPA: hypothetical protein VEM76_21180 [Anaeromyxobacteraceae bacterium]|nr:hypothetical protein [Anaeromyxobacteraceae bacterium]
MAFDRRAVARSELARIERKALLFLAAVVVLLALGVGLGVWVVRG